MGLRPWQDEYKVMGLAPYADKTKVIEQSKKLFNLLNIDHDEIAFKLRKQGYLQTTVMNI